MQHPEPEPTHSTATTDQVQVRSLNSNEHKLQYHDTSLIVHSLYLTLESLFIMKIIDLSKKVSEQLAFFLVLVCLCVCLIV